MLAEGPPFGSPSVNMQKAEKSLEISAFLVFFRARIQIRHASWQGWQDSNLRMPESKSGALPAWLHPRIKFIGLTVTRETVCNYSIIRRRCQANEKLFNNFEQFSEIKRLDARQDFTQAFGALLSEPVSTFRLSAIVKFYRTNYLFSFIERKLLL